MCDNVKKFIDRLSFNKIISENKNNNKMFNVFNMLFYQNHIKFIRIQRIAFLVYIISCNK